MKKMTAFENRQFSVMITQTIILLAAFLGALYIGFKQNEINKNLLNLNYIPSIEITYNHAENRLNIWNKGKTNVYLWGTKFNEEEINIGEKGFLIVPGGFYYLFAEKMEKEILNKMDQNNERFFSLELFIKGVEEKKYIIRNQLLVKMINSNVVNIHTQTLSISQSDW